jgi:hypothetical protein
MSRLPTGDPVGPFGPPEPPEPPIGPGNTRDLYVTGIARSGTTVAAVLLNLHPDCVLTFESKMVADFLQGFVPNCGQGARHHIWTKWYGAEETGYCWGLQHSIQGFENEPVVEPDAATTACVDALWEQWGRPQVFGDKSPMYSLVDRREQVERILPGVKWIAMLRDVDECIPSYVARFGHVGITQKHAEELIREQARGLQSLQNCIYVELSWLKRDVRAAVGAMLEWAGLDPAEYPWEEAERVVAGPPVS